jgi:AmmeMemoRadiSam system protein B/AmmeMemoRadiSam system protein A
MTIKKFLAGLIFGFMPVAGYGQLHQNDRQPAVAGSFYPSDPGQLISQLAGFFKVAGEQKPYENINAIIVPHAGYVFSGQIAALAYARLDPDKNYKTVFLIGTSHHALLNGASVYNRGRFITPLGAVEIDTTVANDILSKNKLFEFVPTAHEKEHSLEVQLPLLQYRLKKSFKIVPIVVGTQSETTCKKLAETLKPYFSDENLFVISSDFSHYPDYNNALIVDKNTGDAIVENSPSKFTGAIRKNTSLNLPDLATSCCGWSSVLTLLNITSDIKDVRVNHLGYANSGDTPYGDKKRVVGYHAFAFVKGGSENASGFSLTVTDKKQLLAIARQTIDSYLRDKTYPDFTGEQISANLLFPCGAFVTLNKNDDLRGCIGRFISDEPLYKVVEQMAVAAAFRDTRFQPVAKNEMPEIEVEISVLTPLKKINHINEFELGKQGIYIVKGTRSGTFLPQVAEQTGWSKEDFLGHCARDKAGIGWDGWKDADLYTYEALVFSEKDFSPSEK